MAKKRLMNYYTNEQKNVPFEKIMTHSKSNKSNLSTGRRSIGGGNEKKKSLIRVRRGHGYGVAGPVYTYVKTDYHGNFKWGARHNVGKGYGRRR